MSTTTKPKRRGRPQPQAISQPDFPHTLKLPDGRTLFVDVPGHMTREMDGETVFLPAAMQFLDRVQAMAMKIAGTPRPAHITALREAMGLTQEKFGAALGVNKLTVSRWERGQLKPGAASLKRLAKLQSTAARRGVTIA